MFNYSPHMSSLISVGRIAMITRINTRGNRVRVVAVFLLVVCLMVALSSCSVVRLPLPEGKESYVGNWTYSEGGHSSVLSLKADNTFTIDAVPRQVFTFFRQPEFHQKMRWSDAIPLTGKWELLTGHTIMLMIDKSVGNERASFQLSLGRSITQLTLWTSVGDPDGFDSFQWAKKLT